MLDLLKQSLQLLTTIEHQITEDNWEAAAELQTQRNALIEQINAKELPEDKNLQRQIAALIEQNKTQNDQLLAQAKAHKQQLYLKIQTGNISKKMNKAYGNK
ncbi:MAG: flagellar protein FliT [Pseudomonadales bacterium]|nr:flagellar protein FliT [Pseudomonadales bacterium]NRA17343.1 flagellar protein FliT [Oceanospirillaceae bacterium]